MMGPTFVRHPLTLYHPVALFNVQYYPSLMFPSSSRTHSPVYVC